MTVTNPNDIPIDRDHLSNLPDHLLVQILSCLPLKSAIVAGALSHQWQGLRMHSTSIDIDSRHLSEIDVPISDGNVSDDYDYDDECRCPRYGSFRSIDYLLQQFISQLIYSLRLHLPCYCHLYSECLSNQLDSIVSLVCARRVERIQIEPERNCQDCHMNMTIRPPLPPCILQTPTLVSLDLGPHRHFTYVLPHEFDFNNGINLPCLKKLGIGLILDLISCKNLGKLISSCPSLEELHLEYSSMQQFEERAACTIEISSMNLKRLDVKGSSIPKILLHCPLLKRLTVKGEHLHLANSGINIMFWRKASHNSQYKSIFDGISEVSSLAVLTRMPKRTPLFDLLPCFLNLTNLRWITNSKQLIFLPLLLKRCPALDNLVVELYDNPNQPPLIWNPVKSRLIITEVKRIEFELHLIPLELDEQLLTCMRFLLSNIKSLEELVVRITYVYGRHRYKEGEEYSELVFREELLKCPSASSECKIEFFGYHKTISAGMALI